MAHGVALIGAGGHARVVADIAVLRGFEVLAYVDSVQAGWLTAPHYDSEASLRTAQPGCSIAVAFAGSKPKHLRRRLQLFADFAAAGHDRPVLQHPSATVSPSVELGAGSQVMGGAVINPAARVGEGSIVNTRAVLEHDVVLGAGSHVAPGAVLLGACKIGECCLIGAGAVILPGAVVADGTLVPALTRVGS
jgi:sugar O-acyltransferase (sialic acid O-acetyltransferase NeuD family)